MNIQIKSELDKLTKNLTDVEKKQIPFAMALALNEAATIGQSAGVKEMQRVFDRPTPFILKSLRVTRASKNNLKSEVGFKNVFGKFGSAVENTLKPHIEGGKRKPKGSEATLRRAGILRPDEFIVPSKALRLDRFGNIPNGTMNKILSNIGGFGEQGYKANTPAARRTLKYIVGEVGGTRGIWSVQGKQWKPVLIFVKQPNYKARFDFYGVTQRAIDEGFPGAMARSLRRALDTAN
ncbi:hypothetical protein [Methylophaga sp.]|uniref:hypothetical protein n=1 Tax=Methylophaga sp. TaxID=2024840 RepID=UPI003A9394AA